MKDLQLSIFEYILDTNKCAFHHVNFLIQKIILWLEVVIALFSPNGLTLEGSIFTLQNLIVVILSFGVPACMCNLIKTAFLKATQLKPTLKQLNDFKYNDEIFYKVIKNQECVEVPERLLPIILWIIAADDVKLMYYAGIMNPPNNTVKQWVCGETESTQCRCISHDSCGHAVESVPSTACVN